jgi:hypothetical protein
VEIASGDEIGNAACGFGSKEVETTALWLWVKIGEPRIYRIHQNTVSKYEFVPYLLHKTPYPLVNILCNVSAYT